MRAEVGAAHRTARVGRAISFLLRAIEVNRPYLTTITIAAAILNELKNLP